MAVSERDEVAARADADSTNVFQVLGFPLLEDMLALRAQNHEEVLQVDVLQIGEPCFTRLTRSYLFHVMP